MSANAMPKAQYYTMFGLSKATGVDYRDIQFWFKKNWLRASYKTRGGVMKFTLEAFAIAQSLSLNPREEVKARTVSPSPIDFDAIMVKCGIEPKKKENKSRLFGKTTIRSKQHDRKNRIEA